jgi:hypothetical protein
MVGDSMDVSDALGQVGIAALGAVFGTLFPLMLPKKDAIPNYDIHGNQFEGGTVVIGDTVLEVKIDKRVFITAKAVQTLASGSEEARERKTTRPPKEVKRLGKTGEGSRGEDDVVEDIVKYVLFPLCGICLVVVGYLRVREEVSALALSLGIFCLAFIFSAVISASVSRVVLDCPLKGQLAGNLILGALALIGISWLSSPPVSDRKDAFDRLLQDSHSATVTSLLTDYGADMVLFVAYQILGLAVLVAGLGFALLHTAKVYAVIGLAVRMRADPQFTSGRGRNWLMQVYGSPAACWVAGLITTLLALGLTSGAAFALVNRLQDKSALADTASLHPSVRHVPDPTGDVLTPNVDVTAVDYSFESRNLRLVARHARLGSSYVGKARLDADQTGGVAYEIPTSWSEQLGRPVVRLYRRAKRDVARVSCSGLQTRWRLGLRGTVTVVLPVSCVRPLEESVLIRWTAVLRTDRSVSDRTASTRVWRK